MLEIGRLKQRKIPGIMVQGFSRILSSTMKSFWKKNILARDLIILDFWDVTVTYLPLIVKCVSLMPLILNRRRVQMHVAH